MNNFTAREIGTFWHAFKALKIEMALALIL